jgi:hypothetical protein
MLGSQEDGSAPVERLVAAAELLYFPVLALCYGLAHALGGLLGKEPVVSGTAHTAPATGPGGRPLPLTKARRRLSVVSPPPRDNDFGPVSLRLFDYLSIAVVFTFAVEATGLAVHALGGESPVDWKSGEGFAVRLTTAADGCTDYSWLTLPFSATCSVASFSTSSSS